MPSDVLYVLRYYPTVSETFVAGEIRGLVREGVRVTVLSMGTREDSMLVPEEPGVEVLHLPRGTALLGAFLGGPAIDKTSIRLAWAVREARRRGITRVHAHFAGEASVLARDIAVALDLPFSVTVHAADLFRPMAGLVEVLRAARPCVTVCEHHRLWIAREYGVEAQVVRCGIEVEGRPLARPELQPARVVCVARPVDKKGLWRLRRAVPPGQLDIVGADRPVSPARVPKRLARAQLFALPAQVATSGDRDGVPVSMMEAMAAGLPVVTRPISGIPELVDDTVGWVSLDFESALSRALADPDERARRGMRARQRVEERWGLGQSVQSLLLAWGRLRS